MIGFRSSVQGVRPILFPSLVPRIGIFCITHRCWPVLWPAGSIRSSSPSGWYENCFKPMALQVPGSPLRPCGTASGFSGSCGSTWIQDLCIFFWGVHCNVNFGMVEFAALTVWLHWMRCQSFRTSIDQMTGLHCNSPGKYDRDCGFAEGPWYSIGDSWRKRGWQSTERHPTNVCQKCCYRLVSLWFWWAATQAWWTFDTSWKYFTFMFALGAGQIDPESTAGHANVRQSATIHLAITRTACTMCENCHMIILCWPYLHATIYNCTRVNPPGASPPVSWLVPCVGFLASRQLSPSPDLTWTNEAFLASQNKMLPFRWLEGSFKLKAFPAPSLPTYGSASGFSQCFSGNGVCCNNYNCLTELNEMSIFQDFNRSFDWVTFQQPRQIWQRLWFPQRLLIFHWWQLAKGTELLYLSLQAVVVPVACLQKAHNGSCRQVLASLTTPPDTPRDTPRAAPSPTGRKGGSPQRLLIFNWAMLKRSFISQSRKELLTPPLTHHLRGHRASLRVEIPVFCLRASLRWLTHLRVLLITRAFLWPPPFLLHKGGSIAWLNCWQLAKKNCESMERHPAKACQKWLLQTFITLILMGSDTSMVDIWNILRAFPFHVCMGSSTNWPRVNCWSCNLR